MKSDEILADVINWYQSGKVEYRDSMLKVGMLCHEYVLARLEEADTVSEKQRAKHGLTRSVAVKAITVALQLSSQATVLGLIRNAMAVALLGEGVPLGTISYSALRYFRVAIKRKTGTRASCRTDAPSVREAWVVVEPAAKYRELFRRAICEGWGGDEIRSAMPRPRGGSGSPYHRKIEKELAHDLHASVTRACPRDAADIIMEMIRSSQSAEQLTRILLDRLGRPRISMAS